MEKSGRIKFKKTLEEKLTFIFKTVFRDTQEYLDHMAKVIKMRALGRTVKAEIY